MNTLDFQKQAKEVEDQRYWALTCLVDGTVVTVNGNFSTVTRLFVDNKLIDPDLKPSKTGDISKCLKTLLQQSAESEDTD